MTQLETTTTALVLLQGGMCADHSTIVRSAGEPTVFLSTKPGDVVIVWDDPTLVGSESKEWWMAQILWVEAGVRDPKVPALFQVSCVDTGVIRWVNADQVQNVLIPIGNPSG